MPAILSSHGCPPPCFTLDWLSMETSRCYCWLFPLSLKSCSPGLEYSSSITCHRVTLLPACRLSPKPIGISFPSFLWISTVVLLQHTHTYTHIHTHSHSLTLLKPEINYTPCQSFLYYVPAILPCSLFWLTLLCICYQVLVMLHKWLSQVNASYRWTISFLRSFFDSSAWFAPYSKVDGHHGHPI